MKTIHALLWSTAVLFFAFSLNAAASTTPLYGATLSASLTTQVSGEPDYTIHTVPINNSTIINAIFETGTSGAAKKSDLALALDVNTGLSLDVINKTAATGSNIVAVIATTGTTIRSSSVATSKGDIASALDYESDYEFTLPNVSGVQVTNIRFKAKVNLGSFAISGLLITFGGGAGSDDDTGATVFQGTIKQTDKIYP